VIAIRQREGIPRQHGTTWPRHALPTPARPPDTVAGATPRGGNAPPAALSPGSATTPARFFAAATPAAGCQAIRRRWSGCRRRYAAWRPVRGNGPPVERPLPARYAPREDGLRARRRRRQQKTRAGAAADEGADAPPPPPAGPDRCHKR